MDSFRNEETVFMNGFIEHDVFKKANSFSKETLLCAEMHNMALFRTIFARAKIFFFLYDLNHLLISCLILLP